MKNINRRSMMEAMLGLTIAAGATTVAASGAMALPKVAAPVANAQPVEHEAPAPGAGARAGAEQTRWFFSRRRRYVRRRRFGFF